MDKEYRLPDWSTTKSVNIYVKEWGNLATQVLQFFPGYSLHSYNPNLCFVKWEIQETGRAIDVDYFSLSVRCAKLLIENNRSGKT